jgi:hypothetical protein
VCNESSGEAFSGFNVSAIGKLESGDLLATFQFDVRDAQNGLLAAGNEELFAVIKDFTEH